MEAAVKTKMKILVPTDFSPCAEAAAQYAVDLARRLDGAVVLLSAFTRPVFVPPSLDDAALVLDPVQVPAEEARTALEWAREQLDHPDVAVRIETVDGSPAEAIVRVARDEAFDLIVMGTNGRTGVRRLLLGSVAECVVRHADCPVLTVRRREAHAEVAGEATG
jgi:nucleotide-binding universal stress UspA family protein